MTTYAWPAQWVPAAMELRVVPNTRTFTGPYAPVEQVIDLLGERWLLRVDLPATSVAATMAAREAFFDRLKGPAHTFTAWHFGLPAPLGTLVGLVTVPVINGAGTTVPTINGAGATVPAVAGQPVLRYAVAQGANTCVVQTRPGRTLLAGSMLGVAGQLVRVMGDTTTDGAGLMDVEFQPRARAAWAAYSDIVTTRPTAVFRLRGDGVPTLRQPGYAQGASFEAVEAV